MRSREKPSCYTGGEVKTGNEVIDECTSNHRSLWGRCVCNSRASEVLLVKTIECHLSSEFGEVQPTLINGVVRSVF